MISVNFTSDVENVVATEHLYQWDNGQKLSISGIGTSADIHFANKKSEKALVVTPTVSSGALVAPIPNSLLTEPYSIIAYVYVPSDNGARTLKTVVIYVEPRTQPSDFVLEEDEGITTLETISQRANAIISGIQSDYNNFKSTIQSELDEMKANTTVPNADTLDGLHANEIAVNPNIAINPNFAINTGGITSVSGGTNSTFLADKWYVSRVVATNTGKAITLAWDGKNNSNGYLQQQILNTSDLFGKKVTLSFNLDGVRKSATVTIPTTKNQRADVTVITGIIAGVTNYMGTHIAIIIFTTTTTSHTISDVKLEIGSISTAFVSPIPSMELLKIQTIDGTINAKTANTATTATTATKATTADTAGTLATTTTNVCLRNISFGTAQAQVTDPNAEGYVAEGALYGQYA